MKTLENINLIKKVNGHGDEIIQVWDNTIMNCGYGKRVFTTKTSFTDDEIMEDAMFEIDAPEEFRVKIAKMVIELKKQN